MKVELLTPLHIGTGNEIPDYEYQRDGQQLLRISLPSLLSDDAAAQNSLKEFATRDGVMSYLKKSKALWDDHLLYELNGESQEFDKARSNRNEEVSVRECLKASFGNFPLLPGSSIKGAMLTGWLFGDGWEALSHAEQANLLQAPFIGFELSFETLGEGKAQGRLYSKLTGDNPEWGLNSKAELPNLLSDRLWIGDIELGGRFEIRAAKRTIKKNHEPRTLWTWVECVAAGAKDSVSGLGRFREARDGKRTVAELCRRCNTFAECVIVAEQQFADYCIRKDYIPARPPAYGAADGLLSRLAEVKQTQGACLLRLGWASHKNATSLTLLNSSPDLSRQPAGRNDSRRRPKSRWSLKDGTPFGWCLVTFEENDYDEDR